MRASRLRDFLQSNETALLSIFIFAVLLGFAFLLIIGPWLFVQP